MFALLPSSTIIRTISKQYGLATTDAGLTTVQQRDERKDKDYAKFSALTITANGGIIRDIHMKESLEIGRGGERENLRHILLLSHTTDDKKTIV